MDPGTNGIRRFGQKTADPVICAGQSCWVSAGPDHPSTAMPRGKALGPGNTLGRRAAACNQSLTCIFRDVDLGANPQASAADRSPRHASRQARAAHGHGVRSLRFDGRNPALLRRTFKSAHLAGLDRSRASPARRTRNAEGGHRTRALSCACRSLDGPRCSNRVRGSGTLSAGRRTGSAVSLTTRRNSRRAARLMLANGRSFTARDSGARKMSQASSIPEAEFDMSSLSSPISLETPSRPTS